MHKSLQMRELNVICKKKKINKDTQYEFYLVKLFIFQLLKKLAFKLIMLIFIIISTS